MSKIPEHRTKTTTRQFDRPVALTCPDCGGALRQTTDGKFVCHIGHHYDLETLPEAQFSDVTKILGAAVRCLNERAELCKILAEYDPLGSPLLSASWEAARQQAAQRSYQLRDFIEQDWLTPEVNKAK